jgi:hypothetical protein
MYKYLLFLVLIVSCQKDNSVELKASRDKEIAKNKKFYTILEKKWEFYGLEFDSIVTDDMKNWEKWQNFTKELYFKPKYSLTAFKQKSKELTKKSDSLSITLPSFINKQEVATRFNVLHLQLKNLEMYLNLEKINQQKVLLHINSVNEELLVIEKMINEVALKSKIVKEAGEENIIRLRDTTRAANNVMKQ